MKIKDITWREWHKSKDDTLIGYESEYGKITVLDRMTGFGDGIRDIETGFKANDGDFWLASGMFDIRDCPELTIPEAIEKIKEHANTCVGD